MKINKNQLGKGIYTEDNLVAGTNISITQELDVPDGDTLLLLHFNDNLNDSSPYTVQQSSLSPTVTYGTGKFGNCITSATYSSNGLQYSYNNKSKFLASMEATIDFWIKKETADKPVYITMYEQMFYTINGDSIQFQLPIFGAYGAEIDISDISSGAFFHVALVFTDPSCKTYINGTLRDTKSVNDYAYRFNRISENLYIQNFSASIDEFRMSSVARWTDNFTPPTQPYGGGDPTGRHLINNTMSAPSVMTGATAGAAGTSGLVPAPAAGDQAKYLTGAGTWEAPAAADTSLSNIVSAGKKVIAHNALPSSASTSWTDLTLGASQATYTMPDDGIVCFNTAGGTVGGYILIGSGNYVNIAYASQTWLVLRVWLFVPKGEQFTVHYSNAGTLQAFGYYKLVGNN